MEKRSIVKPIINVIGRFIKKRRNLVRSIIFKCVVVMEVVVNGSKVRH